MERQNHQVQCVAAADDYRMGRCTEQQYRAQLGRLGFSPAMQDREVTENDPRGLVRHSKITGRAQNKN